MKISSEVVLFNSPEDVQVSMATFNEHQSKKIAQALSYQKSKMVDYLKGLKEEGVIKTIFRPKNKKIQKQLDLIVNAKRKINKTLEKIEIIFK